MAELEVDPLRFLNIQKKRENNRKRADLKRLIQKQPVVEEVSRFVLPSFSSQNSLENGQSNRIKKEYNPLKYFNPEIEQYLNKLKHLKIANSPVMPNLPQQSLKDITQTHKKQQSKASEIIHKNSNTSAIETQNDNKNVSNGAYFNFANTFKNVDNQMMTFAKDQQKVLGMLTQKNAATFEDIDKIKTLYNFNRPGLKKSGSFKMMEKMQEDKNFKESAANNEGISPWQLSENVQQNKQLQQCEVCSRKFNPKSYIKHIKVCQKVFFQKRKPFNSRQKSVQKKG